MAEGLQDIKYEVQHSGDIDNANKILPCLDNPGGNPDSRQTNQRAITDGDAGSRLGLDSEKYTGSTKSDVVENLANHTPTQECQTPAAIKVDDATSTTPTIRVAELDATSTPATAIPATRSVPYKLNDAKAVATEEKKEDKLGIYKALAIKLKKELVKTRDELSKLKDQYKSEVSQLKEQVATLEGSLEFERITSNNTNATLEATVKNLRNQLEAAEQDMQSLQIEFDNYKARATEILRQNQPVQSSSSKFSFEEERYKQMKSLSEEQKSQIKNLGVQLETITSRNKELESELSLLNQKLGETTTKVEQSRTVGEDLENLRSENEALRLALEQYKTNGDQRRSKAGKTKRNKVYKMVCSGGEPSLSTNQGLDPGSHLDQDSNDEAKQAPGTLGPSDCARSSNESPVDDTRTNSSSSFDSGASGYVHIKPTPFEIVSRSSVLGDAQNEIDNLTKAYLDSESTNSLLTEQVRALKEEIRRIQRGNERMELANNLEYLKNVLFKFLLLDKSQVEQKQRLVPVIGTILKLSPEEIDKLNCLASVERPSMTSSFFKL